MKKALILLTILLTSCPDEGVQDSGGEMTLCERVEDKIASCLGAYVPLSSCGEESAEFILNAECDAVLRYIRGELP